MTELKRYGVVPSCGELSNHEEALRAGRIAVTFSDPDWACRMLSMLLMIEKDPLLHDTIDGIIFTLASQAAMAKKKRDHLQIVCGPDPP